MARFAHLFPPMDFDFDCLPTVFWFALNIYLLPAVVTAQPRTKKQLGIIRDFDFSSAHNIINHFLLEMIYCKPDFIIFFNFLSKSYLCKTPC